MAVSVKLATVGVKGAEDTDSQTTLLCRVQQIVCRQGKEAIQQPAVGFKQRPRGVRHRE